MNECTPPHAEKEREKETLDNHSAPARVGMRRITGQWMVTMACAIMSACTPPPPPNYICHAPLTAPHRPAPTPSQADGLVSRRQCLASAISAAGLVVAAAGAGARDAPRPPQRTRLPDGDNQGADYMELGGGSKSFAKPRIRYPCVRDHCAWLAFDFFAHFCLLCFFALLFCFPLFCSLFAC